MYNCSQQNENSQKKYVSRLSETCRKPHAENTLIMTLTLFHHVVLLCERSMRIPNVRKRGRHATCNCDVWSQKYVTYLPVNIWFFSYTPAARNIVQAANRPAQSQIGQKKLSIALFRHVVRLCERSMGITQC